MNEARQNVAETAHDATSTATEPVGASLRALVGLIFLWVSLLLIFEAHTLSDDPVRIGHSPTPWNIQAPGFASLSGGARQLQLPISFSFWNLTPHKVLENVANKLNLELRVQGAPRRLDRATGKIHLENRTLADALHTVLDDSRTGIALSSGALWVFPQEAMFAGDALRHWSAELPIASVDTMLVSPSVQSNLAIVLYMMGAASPQTASTQVLAIELWEGSTPRAMAQAPLDADGKGSVDLLTGHESFNLKIERLDASDRFRVTIVADEAADGGLAVETAQTSTTTTTSTDGNTP